MYCPECLVEYREGFTLCADCRVPLKSGPPPEPQPAPRVEMVPVLECWDSVATALAKASLSQAGIPFYMEGQDEVAVRMDVQPADAFLVPVPGAARARSGGSGAP